MILSWKNLAGVAKTAFHASQKLVANSLASRQKNFDRTVFSEVLSKLLKFSLGVHGTIFQLFEKLLFFISPSDVRREKFRLYVGKFSSGLPKLLSMFHWNNSKKSAFPQKSMSLFNSFGKSATSLASRQKNLDRAVKTAFCLFIGKFWGKRFFKENFCSFYHIGTLS